MRALAGRPRHEVTFTRVPPGSGYRVALGQQRRRQAPSPKLLGGLFGLKGPKRRSPIRMRGPFAECQLYKNVSFDDAG
jgi:hypothetical protein